MSRSLSIVSSINRLRTVRKICISQSSKWHPQMFSLFHNQKIFSLLEQRRKEPSKYSHLTSLMFEYTFNILCSNLTKVRMFSFSPFYIIWNLNQCCWSDNTRNLKTPRGHKEMWQPFSTTFWQFDMPACRIMMRLINN